VTAAGEGADATRAGVDGDASEWRPEGGSRPREPRPGEGSVYKSETFGLAESGAGGGRRAAFELTGARHPFTVSAVETTDASECMLQIARRYSAPLRCSVMEI
jgi:hypothetical protein